MKKATNPHLLIVEVLNQMIRKWALWKGDTSGLQPGWTQIVTIGRRKVSLHIIRVVRDEEGNVTYCTQPFNSNDPEADFDSEHWTLSDSPTVVFIS